MVAGRPRTVSLPPDEMIKLGEQMVNWVIEHDPLHLSEWYSIEKMYTEKQWETFINREEFIPYYEKSLKIVGKKYLDKNSSIRDSVANRFLRHYFKDVRVSEDEFEHFKSNLRKKENEHSSYNPQLVVPNDLAAGASSNIPAKAIPEENNPSPK